MAELLSRRALMAGGAAAAVLWATGAKANFSCAGFDGGGSQQCNADIQIDASVVAQQQCRNWCWAACIETLFARLVSQ